MAVAVASVVPHPALDSEEAVMAVLRPAPAMAAAVMVAATVEVATVTLEVPAASLGGKTYHRFPWCLDALLLSSWRSLVFPGTAFSFSSYIIAKLHTSLGFRLFFTFGF